MKALLSILVRGAAIGAVLGLSACASYSGRTLEPGVSTRDAVVTTMGEPAMRWTDNDGREQLAYPRGPYGTQTFMVYLGADGRLERIEGVLDEKHFARIENGKSDVAAVLRLIGPPQPQWTEYFKARDELAMEWRFCDAWSKAARLDVLFDATTGIVRSTFQRPEFAERSSPFGGWLDAPSCGH
jgi:hypothetical protein